MRGCVIWTVHWVGLRGEGLRDLDCSLGETAW